jgi:hypothetical protein
MFHTERDFEFSYLVLRHNGEARSVTHHGLEPNYLGRSCECRQIRAKLGSKSLEDVRDGKGGGGTAGESGIEELTEEVLNGDVNIR